MPITGLCAHSLIPQISDRWEDPSIGCGGHAHNRRPNPQSKWVPRVHQGTSLAVQWLGLCTSTAGGPGLIPGPGTKIPQAMHSQKKKRLHRGCPPSQAGSSHSIPCLRAAIKSEKEASWFPMAKAGSISPQHLWGKTWHSACSWQDFPVAPPSQPADLESPWAPLPEQRRFLSLPSPCVLSSYHPGHDHSLLA